jgi:hypothetical protein
MLGPAVSAMDFESMPGFGFCGRAWFPDFRSQFFDSHTDFSFSR